MILNDLGIYKKHSEYLTTSNTIRAKIKEIEKRYLLRLKPKELIYYLYKDSVHNKCQSPYCNKIKKQILKLQK
jgi:hypothetical protein